MKMEALGKAEEVVDSEVPPKISENLETTPNTTSPAALEVPNKEDVLAAGDALVFTSPCLPMELRRDSSEFQLALTENDKPAGEQDEESDVSSHFMLSPSSSGHLADSDTSSSAEESEACKAKAAADEDPSAAPGAVTGRKSRRSRSESDTSTMAAKKNRQSNDKQNSRVTKGKVRSQKYRERIRLLRQKREAAARRKYNLLHISSTSDSDLTCGSSTSSSNGDEEVSESSKAIATEIPDAPPVVPRYDISDSNSDHEAANVDNLLAAALAEEHNNALENQDSVFSWRSRELTDEMSITAGVLETAFLASDKSVSGRVQMDEEIHIASSDSEVEIIGVHENARCVHPTGGVIQSVSSSMHDADSEYISAQQTQPWAIVSPQQKSSPPEVVDLTLDEDSTPK